MSESVYIVRIEPEADPPRVSLYREEPVRRGWLDRLLRRPAETAELVFAGHAEQAFELSWSRAVDRPADLHLRVDATDYLSHLSRSRPA